MVVILNLPDSSDGLVSEPAPKFIRRSKLNVSYYYVRFPKKIGIKSEITQHDDLFLILIL